jgi:hypothetical protein
MIACAVDRAGDFCARKARTIWSTKNREIDMNPLESNSLSIGLMKVVLFEVNDRFI